MKVTMKASKTLINAVKGFEGLRLKAYYDSAGVATVMEALKYKKDK